MNIMNKITKEQLGDIINKDETKQTIRAAVKQALKVEKLKELEGKGTPASQIREILNNDKTKQAIKAGVEQALRVAADRTKENK